MKLGGAEKPFFMVALLAAFAVFPASLGLCPAPARGSDHGSSDDQACCQPGRIESARAIIAQAETFKMKATQFHTDSAALIREAAKLRNQAAKIDPSARKTYESDLAVFKQHAANYRLHQLEVERSLGFCKQAQKEYEAMVAQLGLHTEMFHDPQLPNIRPPHVCKEMEMDASEAASLNNSLRTDQQRVNLSEQKLQEAEDKLATAAARNAAADPALQARSRMLDAERQLTGEFASLKTEYDLLHTQHDALSAAGIVKAPTLTKVSGKIKSK